jgi:hypothetical protein
MLKKGVVKLDTTARRSVIFLTIAILLVFTGIANADTLVMTETLPPELTDYQDRVLSFPKFTDPGILTGVHVSFTGIIETDGTVTNEGPNPAEVTLSFDGDVSLEIPGNPPPLSVNVTGSDAFILGPGESRAVDFSGTGTSERDMADISPFIGNCGFEEFIELLVDASAVTTNSGPGNVSYDWTTLAGA